MFIQRFQFETDMNDVQYFTLCPTQQYCWQIYSSLLNRKNLYKGHGSTIPNWHGMHGMFCIFTHTHTCMHTRTHACMHMCAHTRTLI